MDKKKLSIALSKLHPVTALKINLEQYRIEGDFAATLLWKAYQDKCIDDMTVADLGCGNGILGIGALLLGAKFVYFLDSDDDSLEVCRKNLEESYDGRNYRIISGDVSEFNKRINTIIMNPPFGVQKRKAYKIFLETAMNHSDNVYSIHKIESRKFIESLSRENHFKVIEVIEKEFSIKKSYEFHTNKRHTFVSGIWVLKRN